MHRISFNTMKYFAFLTLFIFSLSSLGFAKSHNVRLILAVKKADYAKIENAVRNLNGEVHIKHNLVEGMAVTIPAEKVSELSAMAEITRVVKDVMVERPVPHQMKKPGYEMIPLYFEADPSSAKALSTKELKELVLDDPNTYFPYTNDLTKASDFSAATGHFGENVIVGVIDAGVADVAAISGRVIGGENFTGDGVSATSPLNDPHGTWVSCCIGANAIFGFGNPAVQNAVKEYAPNSVYPDFFGAGIDGIPMVGQAPGALFYALKVFEYTGGGSPRSRIAAALERAIELKQMFNNGEADGINIQIVNLSLSGATMFAGKDEFYAPLMVLANNAGILVVVSAGNGGPGGMTVGAPSDSKNILTVAATNDATHERILYEYYYEYYYGITGVGYLWRPVDNHMVADFSSRGPNADGRTDPDIAAPGTWRFMQGASGGISWASGTSFSAPTVAGAAALLLSARPDATPDQLRGALLRGANKRLLTEKPKNLDQGFGFLNVYKAYKKLKRGVSNPYDPAVGLPLVQANLAIGNHISVSTRKNYSASTRMLRPGQRAEYFYNIHPLTKRVTITISNVNPQLPIDEQNPLFTDDLIVAIQSAKTGGFEDYRHFSFVGTAGATFVLEGSDLDYGISRITVVGDWTNAGKISANVNINSEYKLPKPSRESGTLAEGENDVYSIDVPADAMNLNLKLSWLRGWAAYPTNDLDMLVFDPNGDLVLLDNDNDLDYDGLSWDSPERLSVSDPLAGNWTVIVDGFTIWNNTEKYKFYADIVSAPVAASPSSEDDFAIAGGQSLVPTEFALEQNYPNPFNPSTTIKYQLAEDAFVSLRIYDIQGRIVRTLISQDKSAGFYSALWDGRNESGQTVPSGTYLYQISAGDFNQSSKMILMK